MRRVGKNRYGGLSSMEGRDVSGSLVHAGTAFTRRDTLEVTLTGTCP